MKKITRTALIFCLMAFVAGISCSSNSVNNEADHQVTLTPWPPDNYSDLGAHVTVSWQASDPQGDTLSYDVYFGTTSNPPLVSTSQNMPQTTYNPGVLQFLSSYYWRVDVHHNHSSIQTGPLWHFSTLNVPPNAPSTPLPADGATGVGVNTVFSWQASDPNSGDTLRFDFYLGMDSNPRITSSNWRTNSHDSQWLNQSRAKLLLGQIYSMQNAYRQGHNAYCLNGVTASYWNNDFSLLNILIDSTNCYTYSMIAEINTFSCIATANLDADATNDTWTIDHDSTLMCSVNDTSVDPGDYSYHPNTVYYWKIVVKDNHGNETPGPLWRFTTGADSL